MHATQLIIDSAWKGTLILLGAFTGALVLRRASAAIRHFVWTAALALLLLLPAALQLGSRWHVPLPAQAPAAWVSEVAVTTVAIAAKTAPSHAAAPWLLIVWLSGAVAAAAWFLSGAVRIMRMARQAAPVVYPPLSGVAIRESASVPVPLAWGLRRPVVLLPLEAREWPAERLRSAVLHEWTHIRRHDLQIQLLAQAVCSLYWFHPLVWLSARQLRRERERACDDAVLRAGIAPTEYASHLMELARGLAYRLPAPAMAERSDLETRVRALLDRRRNRRPLNAAAGAAIAACGLAMLLPAALVRADVRKIARPTAPPAIPAPVVVNPPSTPMVKMQERPPAPPRLVAQAASSRQTLVKSAPVVTAPISGVVLDPTSARVAGCQVTASSIDGSNVVQTTRTDPSGGYKFDSLPRGQYLLRFEAPGFAPALAVADAGRLYVRLAVGSLAESVTVAGQKPPVVGAAPPPAPQRIRIGGNVQPARLISQTPPVYPGELQQLGIEGPVVIKAVITEAGEPRNLAVVNSVDPRLDQAAIAAVKQWRYEPTLLNGEPVAVETTVTVDFKLQP
jgi:TonB family protein